MSNKHFSKLAYRLCCHGVCKTYWICCNCSTQVLLYMRMSSKYTTTKLLVNGHRIFSIILMKVVGAFVKPKGRPTIQKGLPLTWRRSSIHLFVLSGPGGSQTSNKSYWSIWHLWVYQGGPRFGESGTGFWLWFFSGPSNQCTVPKFHIYSVPTWLGSHKVMIWDGCAPCGVVIGFVA